MTTESHVSIIGRVDECNIINFDICNGDTVTLTVKLVVLAEGVCDGPYKTRAPGASDV